MKALMSKPTPVMTMPGAICRPSPCQPKFQVANFNILRVNPIGTIVAR
jgi:hypothetical protein